MNGSGLVCLKVGGEVINSDEFNSNIFFAFTMVTLGVVCAGTSIYLLNLSMKYFSNLDVMPIYQSMILMHMMAAGLLVLDESALYSTEQLFLLLGSACLVVLGIYVLTCKQNLVVMKD